jgi:hypothetical protein
MKVVRKPFTPGRHEQRTPAKHDDSYLLDEKLPDPMCCPRCGATYRRGRWTWKTATGDVPKKTCPACQRIEDNFPAGYLTLKGPFFEKNRAQVLEFVSTREARARLEHPMQRLIGAQPVAGGVLVTTTDARLARTIGVALQDAFKGDLDLDFGREENMVRATWTR